MCVLKLRSAKAVRAVFRHLPPPPPPPPPPALRGTGGLHSIAGLSVSGAPVGAAVGFGSFWVRTGSDLYRIDAGTNTVVADIRNLPPAPSGFAQEVAVGEGAIWTSNVNAGSVSRIDPATNRVVKTIPVWPTNTCGLEPSTSCSAPAGIATTPGAIWVALHHESKVVRIDPATNKVVATISVGSGPPAGPSGLAAANGFVYSGGAGGLGSAQYLERIDPATNSNTPLLQLPSGCDHKAAAGTHVWIGVDSCAPGPTGSLGDVDTASASIVGRVALGGAALGVAIGAGAVWAATGSNELVRVDPAGHAVTGRLPFPPGMAEVAAGAEGVWLAVQNAVYRIGQ